MDRPQLLSMTAAEMEEAVGGGFRARQIAEWGAQGRGFRGDDQLPKALRASLEERFIANPVTIREALVQGETEKYLYALPGWQRDRGREAQVPLWQLAVRFHAGGLRHGLRVLRLHAGGLRAQPHQRGNAGPNRGREPPPAGRGRAAEKTPCSWAAASPLANYENTVKFLRLLRNTACPCAGFRFHLRAHGAHARAGAGGFAGDAVRFPARAQRRDSPPHHAHRAQVRHGTT